MCIGYGREMKIARSVLCLALASAEAREARTFMINLEETGRVRVGWIDEKWD